MTTFPPVAAQTPQKLVSNYRSLTATADPWV
jgi:hypothetical protein